jgi:uncharacterized RDD family membrane protein YckC
MRSVQYVSVGRRFVAVLIDSIILGAAGAPFADFKSVQTSYGTSYSINYHGGAFLGIIGIWLVYYTVMEATLGGTAGKMVMGIRVVQEDGSKCTWQGAIVRNLLRIIDGFFVYLVAAILVWSSPTRQRLGDRAADTVVIKKGTNAGMGSGMGGTGSAATMNWPTSAPPGGVAIPPPPPPPPVGPPAPGPGDRPNL